MAGVYRTQFAKYSIEKQFAPISAFAGAFRSSRYNRQIDLDPHNRRGISPAFGPGIPFVVLLGRTQSCNYLTKRLATIIRRRSPRTPNSGRLARSCAPKI